MAESAEKFAQLLSEGIYSIRQNEKKAISIVQDEMGYALGRKGGSAIERWRKGHLPPKVEDVEKLATILVKRGQFGRDWLITFLDSAGYPQAEAFCDELFSASGQLPPEPPFQVVSLLPYFVGREKERATLVDELRQERQTAVTYLHGMAGVGKTSLAAQVAYDLRHHFADGVLWARLDSSSTMSILAAFAEAYQRDVSNCKDVASRSGVVRDLLSKRHTLIVLDNAQTSAQIEPLLPPTGQCAVIVTTQRQDLSVLVGAQRVEIRPFAANTTTSLALFTQILGEERVQSEAELLAEMADELGHLPLALVIAASRLAHEPGWDTAQFGQRLRHTSQRLPTLRNEAQSVRRSFQISYDLLDATAQQIFMAAGMLGRQDFSTAALAALTSLDEEAVIDGLRQLFGLSLVQSRANGRYELHSLLKDFAHSLADQETLAARLVDYWAGFLAEQRYAPGIVTQEMGHIEVALQTAVQRGLIRPLRQILDALMPTLLTRGMHMLAEQYLTQAQTTFEAAHDVIGQNWVWLWLGQLERDRQHLEQAEGHLSSGLQLARQQKDRNLEAQFLTNLGIVYDCLGDYKQGKALLLEALPLARQGGGDNLLVLLEELGVLAVMAGDKAEAADYHQEGLALALARQNEAQAVLFLKSLGALAHLQGEAAQARAFLEQGYSLAQQLGFHKGVMLLANNLGVVAFGAGEMVWAEELLQTAFKEAERLDDSNGMALIGLNLAYWARHNGRLAQSRTHFTRVLTLAKAKEWSKLADRVQAQLDSLAGIGDVVDDERPLSPSTEHLKVFI